MSARDLAWEKAAVGVEVAGAAKALVLLDCTPRQGDETNAVDVWFQHPLGFLEVAAGVSRDFRDMMLEALEPNGGRMSVPIYSDEIVPGSPLGVSNLRKSQALYWSIKEIGWPKLSQELAWMTLCTLRSSQCKKLAGDISNVMKHGLRLLMGFPDGPDIRTGATIDLDGKKVFVIGSLGIMTQDERGHKFVTQSTGASGLKCCQLCSNAIRPDSDLLPDPSGNLVSGYELDMRKFKAHTRLSYMGIQRELKRLKDAGNDAALKTHQTLLGFAYNAEGLLQDQHLKVDVPGTMQWDWMHCYLVGGMFQREVSEMVLRLDYGGLGADRLHSFLKGWSWPKGYGDAKSCFAQGRLTGTASQSISLAPPLEIL